MTANNVVGGDQLGFYETLSKKRLEVRVVDLQPSIDKDSDIRCNLRTISLLEVKPDGSGTWSFEALSYTWGDLPASQRIFINGQPFEITQNLASFLRHRREVNTAVTLWIDAITINQQDALEKNYQIPIINLIYSAASKLTIWLGPASDDSGLAIEHLCNLGSGSPYEKLPLLRRSGFTAVQKLLSRPWWTRIWIVQEVVAGGMGIKQNNVVVQCGEDSTRWSNFVVAAARIKAYNEDLRQPCPNIDNILELDSLRESAFNFHLNLGPSCTYFDLLCRYRHFQATNPRDKLYAIYNMFTKGISRDMPARYDVSVKDVYMDFALAKIQTENDLEILRHCGRSQHNLPSWVPDWSVGLGTHLLPLRKIPQYFNIPWWANPVPAKSGERANSHDGAALCEWDFLIAPYPTDATEAAKQRKIQLRRLEISANGFGLVHDWEEIPPDFSIHNIPDFPKEMLRMSVARGVPLMVRDERCRSVDSENHRIDQPSALRQGEIITERSMKTWLLRELKESGDAIQYSAARTTKADIDINKDESILKTKGILYDTVEVCHEGFVEDLVSDWKNTTRFMVAVGQCKALALAQQPALDRYPDIHKAFWSTIFAGQALNLDLFNENQAFQDPVPYAEWLPLIPPDWTISDPPITATTSGLVDLNERMRATEHAVNALKPTNSDSQIKIDTISYDEYNPELWPADDLNRHKADLAELTSMWHHQPYDLYHRPFSFLHIVPDPYWDTRKDCDKLARQLSQKYNHVPIMSPPPADSSSEAGPLQDTISEQELRDQHSAIKAELMNRTSMEPKGTLRADIEKYALGRQFFVTKGGHFGLGPKNTRKGDRVAVLFGSGVPFILRKHDTKKSGLRGWELIGETYVHGAMEGEVVDLWELGMLEAGVISLR